MTIDTLIQFGALNFFRNGAIAKMPRIIDHFARCKQHWSRNTSCFSL